MILPYSYSWKDLINYPGTEAEQETSQLRGRQRAGEEWEDRYAESLGVSFEFLWK